MRALQQGAIDALVVVLEERRQASLVTPTSAHRASGERAHKNAEVRLPPRSGDAMGSGTFQPINSQPRKWGASCPGVQRGQPQ